MNPGHVALLFQLFFIQRQHRIVRRFNLQRGGQVSKLQYRDWHALSLQTAGPTVEKGCGVNRVTITDGTEIGSAGEQQVWGVNGSLF
jgi:hypothetical protein